MSDSVRPHRRQPTRLPRPWDSPGKNSGVGCHFLLRCRKVKSESEVAQSCQTLSDPMDCSPTGSSVHGIFQARVLEWGAIAFSVYGVYLILKPRLESTTTKSISRSYKSWLPLPSGPRLGRESGGRFRRVAGTPMDKERGPHLGPIWHCCPSEISILHGGKEREDLVCLQGERVLTPSPLLSGGHPLQTRSCAVAPARQLSSQLPRKCPSGGRQSRKAGEKSANPETLGQAPSAKVMQPLP